MFQYRETENQLEVLKQILEIVKNDVVLLMFDERGQMTGTNKAEGIEIRMRRTKEGKYKCGLYTHEGHTWIPCVGGSELFKVWDAIWDEGLRQREQVLAPRFVKLLKRSIVTGSV
jgi:hypothetical protein